MMKSPVLYDALAGFLLIARQGMSTWLMQSMSNSASAILQQDYADEIVKQDFLKICQENAKLESVIVVTR